MNDVDPVECESGSEVGVGERLERLRDRVRAEFDGEVAGLILEVARLTRLRKGEKVAVIEDLVDYFRLGLEDNSEVKEMVETFGEVKLAARLIRRAKVRCRSWADRALVGWGQVGVLGVVLVGMFYGVVGGAVYRPIVAEDEPTNDVWGIVVDEDGKGVGGVEVVGLSGRGEKVERVKRLTDATGRFEFDDLVGDGYWCFSVNDERYGREWRRERFTVVPVDKRDLPVEIRLYESRVLNGRVVNEDGDGVGGVRVLLESQTVDDGAREISCGSMNVPMVATSDEGGYFEMGRMRPGGAGFLLEHDEYARTQVRLEKWGESDGVVVIEEGVTLRGQVVNDGVGVEGVNVAVGGDGTLMVKTDEAGRFEVEHIRLLPTRLRALSPSVVVSAEDKKWLSKNYMVYQVSDDALAEVEVEVWGRDEVESGVKELRGWQGTVDVGKRVAGGQALLGTMLKVNMPGSAGYKWKYVYVRSLGDDDGGDLWADRYSEDQTVMKGEAVFRELPAGRYVVSAIADVARVPVEIEIGEGEHMELTLEAGACEVRGVVRRAGVAVGGGGKVRWSPEDRFARGVFGGLAEIQSDGGYEIKGMVAGVYRFEVRGASGSMPNIFRVEVKGGRTEFDIDLAMGRIEGKLVGRVPKEKVEGDDMWVGEIAVMPLGFPPLMPKYDGCQVGADGEGRFTVEDLPVGRYGISGHGLWTTVEIGVEGEVVEATLEESVEKGEIGGSVVGELPDLSWYDGSHQINVIALRKDGEGYVVDSAIFGVFHAKSGTYRIRNLPVGTYGVLLGGMMGLDDITKVWIGDIEVRAGLLRELNIEVPVGRKVRVLTGEPKGGGIECLGWRMRMPSGDWLEGGSLFIYEFVLPFGDYVVEGAYGEVGGIVRREFKVEEGEGVLEVKLEGLR